MSTTKRIISLILAVVLLASMAFTFSSCKLFKKDDGQSQNEGGNGEQSGGGTNETPDEGDNQTPSTPSTPSKPATPSVVTYTVTVVNAAGEAVAAKIMLVGAEYFIPGKDTNSQGKVTFDVTEGEWVAQFVEIPEGYAADLSTKYTFDESYAAVITLEAAPAETPAE